MALITSEEDFDRLPETVKMRADLQDPAKRTAVREQYKKQLPRFYPDLREQLHLTLEQEHSLFDLLADFQMRHLDLFYTKESNHRGKHERFEENDRRRDEALLSLLGANTLEAYRRYHLELPQRQVVAWFVRRWLDPAHGLSPEQKSQFLAVLAAEQEQTRLEQDRRRHARLAASSANAAQLMEANIRANEESLEDMEAASRRLLHHAASFLSAPQLAALAKMETHKLESQRRWVASLRAQPASPNRAAATFMAITAESDPDDPAP